MSDISEGGLCLSNCFSKNLETILMVVIKQLMYTQVSKLGQNGQDVQNVSNKMLDGDQMEESLMEEEPDGRVSKQEGSGWLEIVCLKCACTS